MISSVHTNDQTIIQSILKLHCKTKIELDPTYSKGNIYKGIGEPSLKFDLSPINDTIQQSDCRSLPIPSNSIHTMLFDPPFLATKGPSLQESSGNIINKRFSVFPTEKELHQFYIDSLKEFQLILKQDGILIFKCQDKVSSGKQYLSHVFIINEAIKLGYYPKDLFILEAKTRIVANWQRNQQHARKFHSYYIVFQKANRIIDYI